MACRCGRGVVWCRRCHVTGRCGRGVAWFLDEGGLLHCSHCLPSAVSVCRGGSAHGGPLSVVGSVRRCADVDHAVGRVDAEEVQPPPGDFLCSFH